MNVRLPQKTKQQNTESLAAVFGRKVLVILRYCKTKCKHLSGSICTYFVRLTYIMTHEDIRLTF